MFVVRPVPHHFLLWLLLAPLILVEIRALHLFTQALELQDAQHVQWAQATIVDHRIRSDGPQIRYQFWTPNDSTIYHPVGLAGFTARWVPITEQVWEQAQRSGSITVAYLPDNPWANQPVGQEFLVENSFVTWTVFLIFDLIWLTEMGFIVRNFFAAQTAAERQIPQRFRYWRSVRRRLARDNPLSHYESAVY